MSDADALTFARAFCLFGSASEIADQLVTAEESGATSVFIQHVGSYDLPHALIDSFGAHILSSVRT